MGQYYLICNLDKQQFIHPHKFGNGLKLLEFGCSSGTMTGLAVLLSSGNNRGGGDLRSDNPIIGSWAGDRIVVAGDYADGGQFLPENAGDLQAIADDAFTSGYNKPENVNLYSYASQRFEDISFKVVEALCDDEYVKQDLIDGYWSEELVPDFLKEEWAAHQKVKNLQANC